MERRTAALRLLTAATLTLVSACAGELAPQGSSEATVGPAPARPEVTASADQPVCATTTTTGSRRSWTLDVATGQPWEPDWDGTVLSSIARYAQGPCANQKDCHFETRTFLVDANGTLTESITGFGRAWNFDATTNEPWNGDWAGTDLTDVPRYAQGPCSGRGPGTCKLESRTFYTRGDRLIESITAYGRTYNFDALTEVPWDGSADFWPANGTDLTDVPRYAQGPCAGRAHGTCFFQTRTFYTTPAGRLVESITSQGRLWEFDAATEAPLDGSWAGVDLTEVPRFAAGPCFDAKAGSCVLATRTYLTAANGRYSESLSL